MNEEMKNKHSVNPEISVGDLHEALNKMAPGTVNPADDSGKDIVEIVVDDYVHIPRQRYEELVGAETTLDTLCRVLAFEKPYNLDMFRAVVGDRFPEMEVNEHES